MTQWEKVNHRITACWRGPRSYSVEKSVCVHRKMSESLHIEWLITLTEDWNKLGKK